MKPVAEAISVPVGGEATLVELASLEDVSALLGGPSMIFGFSSWKTALLERVVFWRLMDDAGQRPNRRVSGFFPRVQHVSEAILVRPEDAVEVAGSVLLTCAEPNGYEPRAFGAANRLYFLNLAVGWPRL